MVPEEVSHHSLLLDTVTEGGQAPELRLRDVGGLVPDELIAQSLDHVAQHRPEEAPVQPCHEFSIWRQKSGALVDRTCPS